MRRRKMQSIMYACSGETIFGIENDIVATYDC